jgi:hypothetical protein
MKNSLVVKRSIVVGGHKTSVSLEDDFWEALKGNRPRASCNFVRPRWLDRFATRARQSFICFATLRAYITVSGIPLKPTRPPTHPCCGLVHHDLAGEVIGAIPSGLMLVGGIIAAPPHLHTNAAFLKA